MKIHIYNHIVQDCEDKQQLDRIESKLDELLNTTNRVKELEAQMDSWLARLKSGFEKLEELSKQV